MWAKIVGAIFSQNNCFIFQYFFTLLFSHNRKPQTCDQNCYINARSFEVYFRVRIAKFDIFSEMCGGLKYRAIFLDKIYILSSVSIMTTLWNIIENPDLLRINIWRTVETDRLSRRQGSAFWIASFCYMEMSTRNILIKKMQFKCKWVECLTCLISCSHFEKNKQCIKTKQFAYVQCGNRKR